MENSQNQFICLTCFIKNQIESSPKTIKVGKISILFKEKILFLEKLAQKYFKIYFINVMTFLSAAKYSKFDFHSKKEYSIIKFSLYISGLGNIGY